MKKRTKKRPLLLLYLCLGLGAAGVLGAATQHHSASDLENRMDTLDRGIALKELFNPADQWVPGEEKKKEVSFRNTGRADQVLRFKATEAWYDNRGTPGDLSDDEPWSYKGTYSPAPAAAHYTGEITGGSPSWVEHGGYYYYERVLGKGQTTPPVMDKVAFSNAVSNAGPGAEDDFSDKRYSLTVQVEALDADPAQTAAGWGMTFTKSGDVLAWEAVP